MADRTSVVPRHVGHNVLPNTPLFSRLVRFANQTPARIAIEDVHAGLHKTHIHLLSDVLALRNTLLNTIDDATRKALEKREDVYMAIVAPGGYEYTVAMLAVLALGAAAVPMTPAVPFRVVEIGPFVSSPTLSAEEVIISSDRALEENAPAVVIFTSGTTGPPKGAVMRRSYVFDCALSIADHYRLTEDDVILHLLPVHHATGVGINFFPFLVSGSRIEFRSGGFDEAWTWKRWKEGAAHPPRRLTFFSAVPTIWMRLRRFYQTHLRKLPAHELAPYVAGARQFRACLCGTSALPQPLNDFWSDLLQQNILQRYGATEFGAILKMRLGDKDTPKGSVGELVSGVDVKLSEGNEGEILVKSPHMFMKYLNDPEGTNTAHDEDGYFRTGDLARREGKYYFILGRASLDIIKSGGYKISALDVERELLGLPYVAEAMVVGVADDEFGQRVAALLSLQEEDVATDFPDKRLNSSDTLTIHKLRRDLRGRLAGYKLPTLLRIANGELPKTVTGKVQKKTLGPEFFPKTWYSCPGIQKWVSDTGRQLAKL
ncbi:hypothetical protein COCC4DRAFT_26971 [Bipolaris maydis ATCC 48331]|uniref:AMP-dependent synthetase/ligase domain-containing protein n=2 Tax=Cochliobolus heterostrophus TaxID=5016 RepID=M2USC9_COCH5|nr:uncharacterized protein COCC4DRAFT_26971 [Bipolaris maydis ATCC 48331]EMD96486.1 hypothetical protein COCHEDRAFT_1199434 [Bipolaris maydis C5]ENI00985.1 hypothetical protein COCC4DRAFT_26971 [Bipolaris maydis ATCC 48331]KAJ5031617.1 hypothetical protein J3E73DRAFT_396602 [Bipolaris maydis]KAJ6273529.1 hypothetical protein PSV08DRAFT_196952 [Bipolaris maydis]